MLKNKRKRSTIAIVLTLALTVGIGVAIDGSHRHRPTPTPTPPAKLATLPAPMCSPKLPVWQACFASKVTEPEVAQLAAAVTVYGTTASCGVVAIPTHLHCWLKVQPGSVEDLDNWMIAHPELAVGALAAAAGAACGLLTADNAYVAILSTAACTIYALYHSSILESTITNARNYAGNNGSGHYVVCVGASWDVYPTSGTFPMNMKINRTGFWGWRTAYSHGIPYLVWATNDRKCQNNVLPPGTVSRRTNA